MQTGCEVKLLAVVVGRGKGEAIVEHLRKNKVYFNFTLLGRGTAPTQWSDFLGFGDSKKDIVFSVVRAEHAHELLTELNRHFRFGEAGLGIAFTINVSSIGSRRFLEYCRAKVEAQIKEKQENEV